MNVVLIGAGGYGRTFVRMLRGQLKDLCNFAATADPYVRLDGVPSFDSIEDCVANVKADFAIIATPIHLHERQVICALEHGLNVLCEKPLVPSVKQLNRLSDMAARSGKVLAVGFQYNYSKTMLDIKRRIQSGEFGQALRLKTLVEWPRDWAYYSRSWAGQIQTQDGGLVRDSVLSNATAHYLQNMLFILGGATDTSASPDAITFETYRANNIESFDTVALRLMCGETEILYYASHAVNYNIDPVMHFQFEKALITVNFYRQDFECLVHHADGRVESLGHALADGDAVKVLNTMDAIEGKAVNISNCETVRPFTTVIDKVFEEAAFVNFAPELIVRDSEAGATYVKNLHLYMLKCFENAMLPREMGMSWG
jgi:predicted dehydrogenase